MKIIRVNIAVCVAAVFLYNAKVFGADPGGEPVQALEKALDWTSKITSYQYTLREYSAWNPPDYMFLTYHEEKPKYYYYIGINSHDQIEPHDIVSWDGTTGMWLKPKTGILYVSKQSFPFTSEWRNLSGLFDPFQFILNTRLVSSSISPQLKDLVEILPTFFKTEKYDISQEAKAGQTYLCLTTYTGTDNSTGHSIDAKLKTYFSVQNRYYPMIVETYDQADKILSRRMVETLGLYQVANSNLAIPYPIKIRAAFYKPSSNVSNTVIAEYSNVTFNPAGTSPFAVDSSKAKVICEMGSD